MEISQRLSVQHAKNDTQNLLKGQVIANWQWLGNMDLFIQLQVYSQQVKL